MRDRHANEVEILEGPADGAARILRGLEKIASGLDALFRPAPSERDGKRRSR